MDNNFTYTTFGNTRMKVCRLGLSATSRPGRETIYKAIDHGVNAFFCYGFDSQMTSVLRDAMKGKRENFLIITGAYNLLIGHLNLRRTLEKRLRQLGTDYIDSFLYLGVMKPKHFSDKTKDEMVRFREEGKVRTIGISCHDRKFAGSLADEGILNALMIRYNAAHRGAEEDIFPHLSKHDPGLISYTATRWGYLLKRPRGYPKDQPIPTASQCYRFVLSNPNVDICLNAPSNVGQFDENLKSLREGPLTSEEMAFMRRFGDIVHDSKKWFM